MKTSLVPLALSSCLIVGGCTFPSKSVTVPRSQVGMLQNVDLGRVVQVRTVEIDGEKTLLGLTGGAALGGAAAYPGAGANTGDYVVQAAASVVGAIAGQAVEELATREQGQELTIVLDNGSTVVVVQETDDGFFREGDRVQVNHSRTGETSVRIALN